MKFQFLTWKALPLVAERAIHSVLCLMCLVFGQSDPAFANTVFFDSFRDGDAQDGMPVTWNPSPGDDLLVVGGNLVVSDSDTFAFADVNDLDLANTSMRTRLRLGNGTTIGIAARWNPSIVPSGQPSGYAGYVTSGGEVGIGLDNTMEVLSSTSSGLRPTQEEIAMQFDVIDDQISLWAWPADEAMPADPLVTATATIDSLATGDVFVWSWFMGGSQVEGVFSFVHVADTHIPNITADFDLDGDVDGDDFLAWQSGFGLQSGACRLDGDADSDGDVDGDDFLIWQTEFGSGDGSASGAVPEPTAFVLLIVVLISGTSSLQSRGKS